MQSKLDELTKTNESLVENCNKLVNESKENIKLKAENAELKGK